eukprot:CAMPEP_0171131296 /NCGR_PEP_ID=MMETSP0766_2-20121228/122438_1 /TAXON_ID=439317 /ORGANISM="Gambierdiscus australes, Strain CAWD 149" /LENGTH=123 /DNA_ID=CAMNT_0011594583 /DNA_START=143 /DNA_END=511 /DNA_ORIENTATION=+
MPLEQLPEAGHVDLYVLRMLVRGGNQVIVLLGDLLQLPGHALRVSLHLQLQKQPAESGAILGCVWQRTLKTLKLRLLDQNARLSCRSLYGRDASRQLGLAQADMRQDLRQVIVDQAEKLPIQS